ncbi:MAG: twin-arginine translocase TatA/TatE family subunit [Firmicutes bacterium]|jgi:Sec-independent protein translocase protein TatA|nr:twin-arginine translocase TatA/TatE family subunit [Bacillota bacterium]MCL5994089.1 twin-arginine translocase TatA/TatE family subunit [Bacillota bacterium]
MFFGPFSLLELLLILGLLVFIFGSKRLGQAARGLVQGFTSMQDAVQEDSPKTREKNSGKP